MRLKLPQMPELRLPISDFKMQQLRSVYNRLISILDGSLFANLTTQDILTVRLNTAFAEVAAIHNLGRIPRGFVVLNVDVSTAVISGVKEKWTTSTIILRSSQDFTTALIVVL